MSNLIYFIYTHSVNYVKTQILLKTLFKKLYIHNKSDLPNIYQMCQNCQIYQSACINRIY